MLYTQISYWGNSEEDIDRIISGIDQTINSGNSWYHVGFFDFAYDEKLDECIEHFEISFHNFSSSYAAIEMRIALGEKFKEELSAFIKADYKKTGMCEDFFFEGNFKIFPDYAVFLTKKSFWNKRV